MPQQINTISNISTNEQSRAELIPHPDKLYKGGEDAFFANDRLFVVSDGVGGWARRNIDPSKYSRFLTSRSGELFEKNSEFYSTNLRGLLLDVYDQNINKGSATYVAAMLVQNQLQICNLGDSGLIVIRFYQVPVIVFQTIEQQHQFNHPFQLMTGGRDTPLRAVCLSFEVQEGDIVIVASDGILDNLWAREILDMTKQALQSQTVLSNLARQIAQKAIQNGYDQDAYVPFEYHATKAGRTHRGGKLDDSTVIVGIVTKSIILN